MNQHSFEPELRARHERNSNHEGWRKRQQLLGISVEDDELEPHEIAFLERFTAAGQTFRWVPRDRRNYLPTHDFEWVNNAGHLVELKHPTLRPDDAEGNRLFVRSARMIRDATIRARNHAVPVIKAKFMIDLDEREIPAGFMFALAEYNNRLSAGDFPGHPIAHVWVMAQGTIHEVQLK